MSSFHTVPNCSGQCLKKKIHRKVSRLFTSAVNEPVNNEKLGEFNPCCSISSMCGMTKMVTLTVEIETHGYKVSCITTSFPRTSFSGFRNQQVRRRWCNSIQQSYTVHRHGPSPPPSSPRGQQRQRDPLLTRWTLLSSRSWLLRFRGKVLPDTGVYFIIQRRNDGWLEGARAKT